METQPTIVVPEESIESIDISNQLSDVMSSLTETLAPYMLLSLVITLLFVVMYIVSQFRRRKLENAILDMQKVLHEMNEREKARLHPMPVNEKIMNSDDKIIATEGPRKVA